MVKKIMFLAMCLLLAASVANAKNKKGGKAAARIDDAAFVADYEAMMDSLKVVGSNVVVVKDNKIIYSHSFGLKNRERGEEMTPNTIFRIASISKSFTATAIMQLVEKGKLDLKADVNKYLDFKVRNPKYPDVPITLEMLLSHTSSLNDSQGYWESFDAVNPATNPDYAKCYNDYRPGTGYEYCNYAFNIMSAVIEKVSGQRFDRYIVQHIMKPLGLKGSHCVDDLDSTRFATLYAMENGVFVPRCARPLSDVQKHRTPFGCWRCENHGYGFGKIHADAHELRQIAIGKGARHQRGKRTTYADGDHRRCQRQHREGARRTWTDACRRVYSWHRTGGPHWRCLRIA